MQRGYYLCHSDDCSPDEKPWLISSRKELNRDAATTRKWKAKWSSGRDPYKFPGRQGSFVEKLLWSHRIRKEALEDPQVKMDHSRPQDPGTLLPEILFDCCPERLTLELLMPRNLLKNDSRKFSLSASSKDKCLAAAERRQLDREFKDFDSFRRWLYSCPDTGTSLQTGGPVNTKEEPPLLGKVTKPTDKTANRPALSDHDGEFVLLGSMQVCRVDGLEEKLRVLKRKLGLSDARVMAPRNTNLNAGFAYSRMNEIRSRVGEMPHFPGASGGSSVACYVQCCVEKPSATPSSGSTAPVPEESFENRVCRVAETEQRNFLFVTMDSARSREQEEEVLEDPHKALSFESEEENSKAITPESHHVLWLPQSWCRIRKRVFGHCLEGEGETEQIKQRLTLGSTDSGNLKVQVFEAEFEALKLPQLTSSEKFCTALALVESMRIDSYWMHDNECPDEIAQLVRDIATYFRTNLLKKSDEELGIQIPDGAPPEIASSRPGLYALMDMYAKGLQNGCSEFCKLNFRPAATKSSPAKTAAPKTPAKASPAHKSASPCKRPAANVNTASPAAPKASGVQPLSGGKKPAPSPMKRPAANVSASATGEKKIKSRR